ncbi:high-affinity zinc transporter periplasmic protein [Salmonella enterica subsp. enterica]|uniref:High-affinity zinc uptake system protein ZnuA n=1 Tax=Salmonella enterica I TaxID=59201 RepID=A0A447N8V6_SALET|nr:high-affinity zinc transporter periplasmic protein [Salmonella enterica subsp. enterica]
MRIRAPMRKKVTYITITANITCIFGSPPEIARATAVAIHEKLVELMPQSRAKLDANLKDFEAQLAATDKQVGNELAPLKGKGYFVFHDALRLLRKTLRTHPARSLYREP